MHSLCTKILDRQHGCWPDSDSSEDIRAFCIGALRRWRPHPSHLQTWRIAVGTTGGTLCGQDPSLPTVLEFFPFSETRETVQKIDYYQQMPHTGIPESGDESQEANLELHCSLSILELIHFRCPSLVEEFFPNSSHLNCHRTASLEIYRIAIL